MKIISFIILCIGLLANAVAQTTSLEDCFALAVKNNTMLQQSKNAVEAGNIDKKQSQFELLPSLNVNAEHLFSAGKNIDPVTNNFINENFSGGSLGLGLQMNIFSGFTALNTIKANMYKLQAAGYNYKKTKMDVFAAITVAYAKLMFSSEQIATIRANNLNTKNELDVIQEKINVGKLSKTDLYAIDTRYKSEQADLTQAQQDSLTAMNELKYAIGLTMQQQLNIITVNEAYIDKIVHADINLDNLWQQILHTHPALQASMMNEKAAQQNLKVAKGGMLPIISLAGNIFSNYNLNETGFSGGHIPFHNQLDNNFGKSIGIYVQVPLFNKMKNHYAVEKEKINLANAKLATTQTTNELERNVQQLFTELIAAKQKFLLQSDALQSGVLAYTAFEERHKLGFISSFELITAKDQLRSVQSRYIQAKYDLFFKYKLIELLLATNDK